MKKLLLILLCVPLISCTQNNSVQDPIDAVKILFKVAETKDFKLLSLICDLDKIGDTINSSDACGVCLLENNFVSECGQNSGDRDGFLELFSSEHLIGEVELSRGPTNRSRYDICNTAMVPVIIYYKNDSFTLVITLIQDNETKSWYLADFGSREN